MRGVRIAEGMVTEVRVAGKDNPNVRLMITVDTSQEWSDFANPEIAPVSPGDVQPVPAVEPGTSPGQALPQEDEKTVEGKARKAVQEAQQAAERAQQAARKAEKQQAAEQAAQAAQKAEQAAKSAIASDNPEQAAEAARQAQQAAQRAQKTLNDAQSGEVQQGGELQLAVTKRTHVYVFARSPEGVNLYGARTFDSPEPVNPLSPRGDLVRTDRDAVARGPQTTNWTNIREGAFVEVRYKPGKDGMNEALNVSLVELPLISPETPETPIVPGSNVDRTPPRSIPARAPGVVVPGPALPNAPEAVTPDAVPVREPRVSDQPVAPRANIP